jgi:hypothetical protein
MAGAATASVRVDDLGLSVDLADGRTIVVTIERAKWRIISGGHGLHWSDLDEDISMESLLTGHRSRERESSLKKWLESRRVR